MKSSLTISLPEDTERDLTKAATQDGVTKDEFVSKAVKVALWRRAFRASRAELVPQARMQGILTDEDVFKIIS
ncbi:MAG: hypothetical protein ABI042_08060 [Verrucomicrobiota bacterium]